MVDWILICLFSYNENIRNVLSNLMQMEHDSLKTIKPRIVDNYDELEEELEEVELVLSEKSEDTMFIIANSTSVEHDDH